MNSDDQKKHIADLIQLAKRDPIEACARLVEGMVVGGRAWTEEQEIAAKALFGAAEELRKFRGHVRAECEAEFREEMVG